MSQVKDMPITANRLWQTYALHGGSGAGKTTLAAGAPKPLIIDANGGTLSIADVPELKHARRVEINSMEELEEIYDRCSGTATMKKHDWSQKYSTVIFDHFSDLQGIILDELVEKAMAKDERRDDTVEQREYGIMGNKLRRYLRKFKRLPMHKILICDTTADFDSGQAKPHLIGAMQHQLPHLVDHTIYLEVTDKNRRVIHFDENEDWYAKTRCRWMTKEQKSSRWNISDLFRMTKIVEMIAAGPPASPLPSTPAADVPKKKKIAQ